MKTTFIYALCEPGNPQAIRYVGKADKPKKRFSAHLSRSAKTKVHLGLWLNSLASRGEKPILEILDEVSDCQWPFWEREYIRVLRAIGFDLVNTAPGGVAPGTKFGKDHHMFGKPVPEERRRRISAKLSGVPVSPEVLAARPKRVGVENPFFGHKHTEETRKTIREKRAMQVASDEERKAKSVAMTGEGNHMFGKPVPEERRLRISATLKGRKLSEEALVARRARLAEKNKRGEL